MRPFLILQLRKNDEAADGEFSAFLKFGGLADGDVHRVRMEKTGVPELDLGDYSGVIIGGGPYNVSDDGDKKAPEQKRFEPELAGLLDRAFDSDFPVLGACYGLGALAVRQGGVVSQERYSEPVGGVTVRLTEEGRRDPLTAGLPDEFRALRGHKEACQGVPNGAKLLATSDLCPVQMIRVRNNLYATQFHPELDVDGIIVRINVYRHAGYFPPEDADKLIAECRQEEITVPMTILKRFVDRYRT